MKQDFMPTDSGNPYVAAATADLPRTKARAATRLVLWICGVFSVPAIASLMIAWPCLNYGFAVQHHGLVSFFACGGHAIVMVTFLVAAVATTRMYIPDSRIPALIVGVGLSGVYLPAVVVCWLMVAVGAVSWT